MEQTTKQTNVFKGVIASSGIAIGKIFLIEEEEFAIVPRKIPKQNVKKEVGRFKIAVAGVTEELAIAKKEIIKVFGKEHSLLADAHLLMLEDPLLNRDVIRRINEEGVNAEYALWTVVEKVVQSFEKIDDEYFRERKNDIQEIGKRIMRQLTGPYHRAIAEAGKGSIIVAHSLGPSDTIKLKERNVGAFVTDVGGRTSHIALFAQDLDIPAVVGLKNLTLTANHEDDIIVDGNQGLVILNPDEQTLGNYKREYDSQIAEKHELEKLRDLPAQTSDGHRVALACNVDSPEEVKTVLNSGSEGIGLLRTEFIYLKENKMPSEEQQYEICKKVVHKMLPYSVIIRTLDLGGDKLMQMGFEGFTHESNPFLGLRAIRLCFKYPEIFKAQLRAILRASKEGKVKIMFPMISSVEEFKRAKKYLEEAKSELQNKGLEFHEKIEVGAMIEIPSAALTADLIAREADFLSIGTNDLIQYTFAVDRMNESVAYMYEPMHLAILRLIKRIIDAGHQAGKWVGMCGEMAADTSFTSILVGLGLDEFSIPPIAVPKIKKAIRSITLADAQDLAREVLSNNDREAAVSAIRRNHIT
ncbi:MAG: phosphoenolpyruvate--protein phosphotransferase [Elusimicrobia bacterium]|nr:phosphoenolpyruvate--protein phosphotransferase [Elusimicrobiota bacterium]MBU2615272.1 phosphoenolpyruvate--protein phosphotransferase [Elusimicrobiota bacterium]